MYLSLHITVYTFNMQLFLHGKKHFYQRNHIKLNLYTLHTRYTHVTLHVTPHVTEYIVNMTRYSRYTILFKRNSILSF